MPKGNPRATGKKAGKGPEIVQYVRRVLIGAMEIIDQKDIRITDLLAKELEANPLKFLEVVSKYCPREVAMELSGTITHRAEELSDDELADIATRSGSGATETQEGASDASSVH